MTATASNELVEQLIETCPKFCASLTTDEVAEFIKFTNYVEGEQDQIIADVGAVGEEFYLVLEGRIRLVSVDGGKELDVGRITAGGMAGEMSFFDRQPRSIRLRASRKKGVRLLAISRPMYKRLCVQHPYIAVNLLEFVVMDLDQLIRNSSKDIATMYRQVAGIGYR